MKRVVAMNASGTTIIGRLIDPQVTGRVVPIVGESYLHLYGGDWVLSELEEHSPEIDQVVKFAVDEMLRANEGNVWDHEIAFAAARIALNITRPVAPRRLTRWEHLKGLFRP